MKSWAIALLLPLLVGSFACSEEDSWSSIVSEAQEDIPSVCEEYCDELVECEWEGGGPLDGDAIDSEKEKCAYDCAWDMERGCELVKNTDYPDETEDYEYIDFVTGEDLLAAFECLWETGNHGCQHEDFGDFHLMIDWDTITEEECEGLNECYDMLDVNPSPYFEWHEYDYTDDICFSEGTFEVDGDIYISYRLSCHGYFQIF